MNHPMKWHMVLCVTLLFGLLTGCTKEGFGGDASLSGTVNHHLLPIPSATVYIKFDAQELPGTDAADYDASVTADADGLYSFEGLEKGGYYIYGVGYDSAISMAVVGGLPVKLGASESKMLDLPVTE